MKILMTGASSFTGFWFAKKLSEKGHHLTLTFTKNKDSYHGLRAERIQQLSQLNAIECIWSCSFGSDSFFDLVTKGFDIVCHHGAYVEDYKSLAFNTNQAVTANTNQCDQFILRAKENGIKKVMITGSVFEANEGAGSLPLVAFSPYGLSKTFSSEIFRFWAWKHGIALTKFVIPNPFGPYEEPRFCNYLVQNWAKGITPSVKTPDYIRDNIHIDLLADCYVKAVEQENQGIVSVNPSGYIGSQKEFTLKFAEEIGKRLALNTDVIFGIQQDFDEPMARTNTFPATEYYKDWNESNAWDQAAIYYERLMIKEK